MTDPSGAPVTWLVLGDKGGDNGQVETLAAALPWPCERKHLRMRDKYVHGKPRFSASLHHIDLEQSDPLCAPWPDLVMTIGRRPSMVAQWIKKQSGGKTRVVLIGKPTARMLDFDLIISSAEKHMPPMPNFVAISLPLMRVDEQATVAEAKVWEPLFAPLPRPLIAILVGGATSPFVMDRSVAKRLLETARWICDDLGGTAYFSSSRRTAPVVLDALRNELPAGAHFYEWQPGATDNPYRGLLGSADGVIVTGDSISMMVEAIYLGKRLAIFPLPYGALGRLDQLRRSFARWLFEPESSGWGGRLRHWCARVVFHLDIFTLLSSTRDFRHFHQMLVERGLAVWSGQPFREARAELPEDIPRAVNAIKALVART